MDIGRIHTSSSQRRINSHHRLSNTNIILIREYLELLFVYACMHASLDTSRFKCVPMMVHNLKANVEMCACALLPSCCTQRHTKITHTHTFASASHTYSKGGFCGFDVVLCLLCCLLLHVRDDMHTKTQTPIKLLPLACMCDL